MRDYLPCTGIRANALSELCVERPLVGYEDVAAGCSLG